MKVLVVAIVGSVMLFLFAGFAFSALSQEVLEVDPANPDTCIKKSDNITLKLDDSQPGQNCSEITCIRHGIDGLALETATCGTSGDLEPNCTVIEDKSKPYPGCCQRIVCQN